MLCHIKFMFNEYFVKWDFYKFYVKTKLTWREFNIKLHFCQRNLTSNKLKLKIEQFMFQLKFMFSNFYFTWNLCQVTLTSNVNYANWILCQIKYSLGGKLNAICKNFFEILIFFEKNFLLLKWLPLWSDYSRTEIDHSTH